MAKGSENDFPSILVTEQGSAPAAPASGKQRIYMKTDHKLYHRDSGGTETEIGAGAGTIGGATGSTDDAIITANGTGGATVQGSLATVDASGGINIPTGQTYNINGSPHTHAGGSGNATESVNAGSETLTTEGDLNFTADGPVVERYDGSAWQTWGPLFKLTKPPAVGNWAWENQGTATLNSAGGVLTLTAPAAAASYSRILKMAAPATPYTITALVGLYVPLASWYGAGLLWRQSSDGKLVYYGYQNDGAPYFTSFKVPGSANNLAGVYTPVWSGNYGPLLHAASPFMWLRIRDEGATGGSNRICSFSFDGRYWIEHHVVTRTDYLTADEVGFGVMAENNAFGVGMTVFSWEVT